MRFGSPGRLRARDRAQSASVVKRTGSILIGDAAVQPDAHMMSGAASFTFPGEVPPTPILKGASAEAARRARASFDLGDAYHAENSMMQTPTARQCGLAMSKSVQHGHSSYGVARGNKHGHGLSQAQNTGTGATGFHVQGGAGGAAGRVSFAGYPSPKIMPMPSPHMQATPLSVNTRRRNSIALGRGAAMGRTVSLTKESLRSRELIAKFDSYLNQIGQDPAAFHAREARRKDKESGMAHKNSFSGSTSGSVGPGGRKRADSASLPNAAPHTFASAATGVAASASKLLPPARSSLIRVSTGELQKPIASNLIKCRRSGSMNPDGLTRAQTSPDGMGMGMPHGQGQGTDAIDFAIDFSLPTTLPPIQEARTAASGYAPSAQSSATGRQQERGSQQDKKEVHRALTKQLDEESEDEASNSKGKDGSGRNKDKQGSKHRRMASHQSDSDSKNSGRESVSSGGSGVYVHLEKRQADGDHSAQAIEMANLQSQAICPRNMNAELASAGGEE